MSCGVWNKKFFWMVNENGREEKYMGKFGDRS